MSKYRDAVNHLVRMTRMAGLTDPGSPGRTERVADVAFAAGVVAVRATGNPEAAKGARRIYEAAKLGRLDEARTIAKAIRDGNPIPELLVERINIRTGATFTEDVLTPPHLSPAYETYHCM